VDLRLSFYGIPKPRNYARTVRVRVPIWDWDQHKATGVTIVLALAWRLVLLGFWPVFLLLLYYKLNGHLNFTVVDGSTVLIGARLGVWWRLFMMFMFMYDNGRWPLVL
jgi:hypothetical protein